VAAEALGISRSSLYLLIQNGELETVTVGRRRLVPADAITDYVDRLRQVEGVTPSSEAAK
jgi:excisionase family DNA binding protein